MFFAYKTLLLCHIAIGFVSLVLFWVPVLAKKGGALHTRSGHWFAKAMYAVGFSALALAAMLMIDPIGFKFEGVVFSHEERIKVIASAANSGLFLLAISLLVLVSMRNGLQAVRAKGNHALMRRINNLVPNAVLFAVGVWLAFAATNGLPMSILVYIFAGLCIATSLINLRFALNKSVTRREQIIAHLTSVIGAGIGSHTAFFVFGASRVFTELLSGYAMIIPWVLPTIIGNVIIWHQVKRHQLATGQFK